MAFSAVNGILAFLSAIALYATFLGKENAPWPVYFAGSTLLIITVHQTISFFFGTGLKRQFKRGRGKTNRALEPDLTTGKLIDNPDEAYQLAGQPSVIEDTTELLETAPVEKPRLSERG